MLNTLLKYKIRSNVTDLKLNPEKVPVNFFVFILNLNIKSEFQTIL